MPPKVVIRFFALKSISNTELTVWTFPMSKNKLASYYQSRKIRKQETSKNFFSPSLDVPIKITRLTCITPIGISLETLGALRKPEKWLEFIFCNTLRGQNINPPFEDKSNPQNNKYSHLPLWFMNTPNWNIFIFVQPPPSPHIYSYILQLSVLIYIVGFSIKKPQRL